MLKKVLLATAAAGLLSACAGDRWDVDQARSIPVQGGAFNQALHAEYITLAADERAEADWRDTAYFLDKARAAAGGEMVAPTALDERDLDARFLGDGQVMRTALMSSLPAGRTALPKAAAQAQAGFDCWMQEAEEGHQPADIAACKEGYALAMAAMKQVMVKPAPAPEPAAAQEDFVVRFVTSSAALDAEARATLKAAAEAYRAAKPVTVVIAGHTDTVGADNQNILLSQKRAETVANALATLGVDTDAMALEAYGEEQPAVETGDGVAEPRNRRVEITFKNDSR